MTCAEFENLLHALFIGELPPGEREGLEEHARTCDRCSTLMETAYELTCQEAVAFLSEYVDGTMPAERKAVFERHLAICPECTAYLASYRQTIALTKSTAHQPGDDLPAEMPEALVRAIVKSLKPE